MQNSSAWINSHMLTSDTEVHSSTKASVSLITITSTCQVFLKGEQNPQDTQSKSRGKPNTLLIKQPIFLGKAHGECREIHDCQSITGAWFLSSRLFHWLTKKFSRYSISENWDISFCSVFRKTGLQMTHETNPSLWVNCAAFSYLIIWNAS